MGISTTEKLLDNVKEQVRQAGIKDPAAAREVLKRELVAILSAPEQRGQLWGDNATGADAIKPAVILVVGVNGTGKTTNVGKLAFAFQEDGKKVVLAASDTFRAAAIDQLKAWGERIGSDVIAHQPGADPSAVAFDAISAAQSRDADVVIIDTAGRLHTKTNLMEEMRKIHRVIQRKDPTAPHEVLLVLDATTGQNALVQAQYFTEAVTVTGVLLAKLDGTARGGSVFAICDQLGIPIKFVGTGERPDDLSPFWPEEFVEALLG